MQVLISTGWLIVCEQHFRLNTGYIIFSVWLSNETVHNWECVYLRAYNWQQQNTVIHFELADI
jgi:hypothetical protein